MSLITSPQYFGIQDATVGGATPFGVRIYYPTEDDVIVGAPLAPGPHPLVVFAHGNRQGTQNALVCPANPANDYKRWTVVLGALARSGFVVAAPALGTVNLATALPRLRATVQWMRTQWSGNRSIHGPAVLDPHLRAAPAPHMAAENPREDTGNDPAPTLASHHPVVPIFLGEPTPLALIGHSWGARGCAIATADTGARAFASIAGTFDDNESIGALRATKVPTLMICGTTDHLAFSTLGGLWPVLPSPKYQAAVKEVGHWEWFGRRGPIRYCDGSPSPWPDAGLIAGELIAGFLTRHLAGVQFDPPHPISIPLLRPWGVSWFDHAAAIQVRWDAPGQQFYPLPPAGDGILGPWASGTAPW